MVFGVSGVPKVKLLASNQIANSSAVTVTNAIFDLNGREITAIVGYDDATWTPEGKVIATGKLYDPGVFEINRIGES